MYGESIIAGRGAEASIVLGGLYGGMQITCRSAIEGKVLRPLGRCPRELEVDRASSQKSRAIERHRISCHL